ncbi:hypothetical protein NUW54_g75 [Trametes sanguinea]|uniref:Uncharacterized protein n=1 Tax=Trametes sanguinea TaxID=158606 RepID=A0ACC1QC23_9APHY|nr:hypothetical protein NUW54_g75 [Trametes sanguinea]
MVTLPARTGIVLPKTLTHSIIRKSHTYLPTATKRPQHSGMKPVCCSLRHVLLIRVVHRLLSVDPLPPNLPSMDIKIIDINAPKQTNSRKTRERRRTKRKKKGGKPGNQGLFHGPRAAFLSEYMPRFVKLKNGARKAQDIFWRDLFGEYWQRWPWQVPLDKEPGDEEWPEPDTTLPDVFQVKGQVIEQTQKRNVVMRESYNPWAPLLRPRSPPRQPSTLVAQHYGTQAADRVARVIQSLATEHVEDESSRAQGSDEGGRNRGDHDSAYSTGRSVCSDAGIASPCSPACAVHPPDVYSEAGSDKSEAADPSDVLYSPRRILASPSPRPSYSSTNTTSSVRSQRLPLSLSQASEPKLINNTIRDHRLYEHRAPSSIRLTPAPAAPVSSKVDTAASVSEGKSAP